MGTRIKSNAVDRLPNNKHPNMKTSTFFALAASCALLASGASAEGPEYHDDDEYHHDPCECRDSCEYVNDYHICYVRDPYECHDAFPSRYYEDEKWIWCPWKRRSTTTGSPLRRRSTVTGTSGGTRRRTRSTSTVTRTRRRATRTGSRKAAASLAGEVGASATAAASLP